MAITLSPRRLLVLGALGIVAAATLGFAATNTVPDSNAGDGSGAVSGYTVTNIHYTLGANPATTSQVSFDVTPAFSSTGTNVISLDGGTTWITCSGASSVTCPATVSVLSLGSLRVVAAQ
ncbi:MAG: hypothetical protein IT301_16375 [Dehalococcoidia bacterium]|nr:hypothetical protein [Dehalococcoidia bacterium]